MKTDTVKKVLNALEDYYEIQPVDIANFLGMNPGRVTECKNSPTIDNLSRYFSIYNDAEVNFALSKRVPLMECIYYQMHHLSYLVNKLAQEQSDPFEKSNILAKQKHLELVMDYFNPCYRAREFFCQEDEAFYRISDVKKALKLILQKKEYKEQENLIKEAIDELNTLEEKIIKKRAEIDNLSNYDVVDKFEKLKAFFNQQQIEKIDYIINKLKTEVVGSYRLNKADSFEENGSDINFNFVLDEFFDIEHYDNEIDDALQAKIESISRLQADPIDVE